MWSLKALAKASEFFAPNTGKHDGNLACLRYSINENPFWQEGRHPSLALDGQHWIHLVNAFMANDVIALIDQLLDLLKVRVRLDRWHVLHGHRSGIEHRGALNANLHSLAVH